MGLSTLSNSKPHDPEEIAHRAIERAKAHGAEAADAVIVSSVSFSASCRLGKLEDIDRSETGDLGLRVLIGKSQANVSATDFSDAAIDTLAERCVAMAKSAPEDPWCGLADRDKMASSAEIAERLTMLDIYDPRELSGDRLRDLALEAEEAALGIRGVTNSLGAGASAGSGGIVLATSDGFSGHYSSSGFNLSCAVLAGEGTAMERDYDYASTVHFDDLDQPQEIGRTAGERAVARLNPDKLATDTMAVVYDRRISASLVRHFAGAVSGSAVARGTSFLRDRMATAVFANGVTIVDDPWRKRGLGSKPFDGEGVENAALTLIDDGVLGCWLLDSATARQLGLETNGRASRGIGAPPSPSTTNLYMVNGAVTPEELIGDIRKGFYVTDLIGMGVNPTTGDYSRGASGFLIENGKLTSPVSEVTIAGNLRDMYLNLTPANDLEFRFATNAPTLRIEGLTVAGK